METSTTPQIVSFQMPLDAFENTIANAVRKGLSEMNGNAASQDKWITREKAAEIIGASTQTISNRLSKGLYEYRKVGQRVLLSQNSVLDLLTPEERERVQDLNLI